MGALSEGGLLFEQQQQHAEQHPQWSFNVQCVTFLGAFGDPDLRYSEQAEHHLHVECLINACDNSELPINLRHVEMPKTLQHMYDTCVKHEIKYIPTQTIIF